MRARNSSRKASSSARAAVLCRLAGLKGIEQAKHNPPSAKNLSAMVIRQSGKKSMEGPEYRSFFRHLLVRKQIAVTAWFQCPNSAPISLRSAIANAQIFDH